MTLKEQIQKDRVTAMKEGNKEKRLVLSTLVGELDRIDKNPTDAQVIKKVKSLIDSNIECGNESENVFLEGYLPQMLSDNELETIITNYINQMSISGMSNMGKVMAYLKNQYPGKYDGKTASQLVKNVLS